VTQWRVTPQGERQWLSADGNWYPTESAALLAGLPQPARAQPAPSTPATRVPPPPLIRQVAKPRKRKVKWGRVFIAAAVVIGIVAYFSSKTSSGGDIHHQVYAVVPLDAQHVRIFIRWTNDGKSPASASCSLQATAYSQFGDDIGSGFDSTGTNGNVDPGQTQVTRQDLVITDNNAVGVRSTKDVSITDC
jgi:hypothetical protein